ncbi:MAG: endonuclease/exonuclease/phosphatase family protein, partial [Proteiniphilum sp.]
ENRFSFICTHFCHESEARRILQARKINELFVSDDDEIIILGGDFNAAPSAFSIATLKEKWFDSTSKEFTFPSPKPTVKIDYIFYRGNDALQVKETQVVPDLVTSDHRPVLTVFEWLQKK